MKNIGAAMAGGNGKRVKDDYYPTPYGVTEKLLPHIEGVFPKFVHECACGQGHMSRILRENDYDVVSTDLVNRGYGRQLDFLKCPERLADAIITNPPFSLADEFLAKCIELRVPHVALVLPLNFWSAQNRYAFFDIWTPSLVLPMTWRIDSSGEGRPTMNAMWVVWTPNLPPVRGFFPLLGGKADGTLPEL